MQHLRIRGILLDLRLGLDDFSWGNRLGSCRPPPPQFSILQQSHQVLKSVASWRFRTVGVHGLKVARGLDFFLSRMARLRLRFGASKLAFCLRCRFEAAWYEAGSGYLPTGSLLLGHHLLAPGFALLPGRTAPQRSLQAIISSLHLKAP